jgi:hypothetical protein
MTGILPGNESFPSGERLIFFQTSLFKCSEETQVALERKPSVLEAGTPSTFFPGENSVSFSMEYFKL